MMLELLETGKALYALAAVCVLGILSRLVARNLYKRLMRETDNMTLTKNRFLRDLRQKAENTYRLNQGICNTKVFLERQLAGYRRLGLSLDGWGNLAGQLTVLCFFLGGAAAFGAYWYRCDSYFVALYGSVGVLAGLLTLFMDYGVNLGERKNQLVNALQDYLENSLFQRLARETASAMEGTVREVSRDLREGDNGIRNANIKDVTIRDIAAREGVKPETGIRDRSGRKSVLQDNGVWEARRDDDENPSRQRPARHSSRLVRKSGYSEDRASGDVEPIRDVDYLKRSLEQIAASREKNAGEGDWIKNLSPKELELVGEILKQYLT